MADGSVTDCTYTLAQVIEMGWLPPGRVIALRKLCEHGKPWPPERTYVAQLLDVDGLKVVDSVAPSTWTSEAENEEYMQEWARRKQAETDEEHPAGGQAKQVAAEAIARIRLYLDHEYTDLWQGDDAMFVQDIRLLVERAERAANLEAELEKLRGWAGMTVFQWLLERGQPEGHVPPVYLEHTATRPATHKCWTPVAHDAAMWPSKETAEAYMREEGIENARPVEHGFMHRATDQERVRASEARAASLRDALEQADREASIAHDAIWDKSVASNELLHDNDNPLSAQSAIWRLHEKARAALIEEKP